MPNTHSTLTSLFDDIADAIRAKTGGSGDIVADNFPSAIAAIPSGGASGVQLVGTYSASKDTETYSYGFLQVNDLSPDGYYWLRITSTENCTSTYRFPREFLVIVNGSISSLVRGYSSSSTFGAITNNAVSGYSDRIIIPSSNNVRFGGGTAKDAPSFDMYRISAFPIL